MEERNLTAIFEEAMEKIPADERSEVLDEKMCGAEKHCEDDAVFFCTRTKGHTGRHIAYGMFGEVCEEWEEDSKETFKCFACGKEIQPGEANWTFTLSDRSIASTCSEECSIIAGQDLSQP